MDILKGFLLLAAIVCFLLATFGAYTRINLGWLGLAFATAAYSLDTFAGNLE